MTLSVIAGNIPGELTARPQWVLWRMEERDGKPTKVPYDVHTNDKASCSDPETWGEFGVVLSAYQKSQTNGRYWTGIGYQLAADDPICGIDLDKCLDLQTGEVAEWATAIVDKLHSYTERSPSGTGIRIFCHGQLPPGRRRKGSVEMYQEGRFLTTTGNHWGETPLSVQDRSEEIKALHAELFPEVVTEHSSPHSSSASGPTFLTDGEILDLCHRAQNSGKFSDLYRGSVEAYQGDDSAADAALCSLFAFYTQDAGQIDRLFSGSGLCREKWRARADYRERTIRLSLSGLRETYSPPGVEYQRAREGREQSYREQSQGASREASPDAQPEPWETPISFTSHNLPVFPLEALPDALAEYVSEVAASTQVPLDMPAIIALSVVAAAGARRCLIQIGQTHSEPLNLYTATVMLPGSRKSACMDALAAPLFEAEREMIAAALGEVAVATETRGVEDKRLAHLRDLAAKAKESAERECLMQDLAEQSMSLTEVPALPRLLIDDCTPERLAGLMADQHGTMALFSAEGGIFGTLAGRYSDGKANLDLFLKAHSGESYRVDRQGRPPVSIDHACLTMTLTVQPDVLASLADTPAFRGRGLLGRFLYSLPENLVGTRLYQNRPADAGARRRYEAVIHALLALPDASAEDLSLRHVLRLEGAALTLWAEFADGVERRQAEGGDLSGIRDWASKIAGAVARLAGGMHLAENVHRGCPWAMPISPETVAAAWTIGEYLTAHALAAFSQMGADANLVLARRILRWIERTNLAEFSLRDCHQAHRSVTSPSDLLPALSLLCERGYLRLKALSSRPGAGRSQSPVYEVNPSTQNTHNTQN